MNILLILLLLFFMYVFPMIRCIVLHPVSSGIYAVADLFLYLLHRAMNLCPYGYIRAYTGLFDRARRFPPYISVWDCITVIIIRRSGAAGGRNS